MPDASPLVWRQSHGSCPTYQQPNNVLVDALAYGIGTAMLLFARLGSPLRKRNLGRPINVRRVPYDRPPKRRLEPGRPVKTAAPGGRLFRWMRPFERRYADDSHTGRRGMRPKQAFQ